MATVLVVEDSHSQRECISYQLRWHGWTVIQASDGLEALEKIKATSPDVVLLDLVMPRIDGYQVCRLIKANPETRNIPIVFLTGKARPLTLYASIIQHAEAYVSKPWQPQELLNTVKQVLANARKLHAIASTESWIEYGLLNLKMIKAYQSRADAWTKYGLQLTMFYQRAIASFQQALKLDPDRLQASQYLTSVQQNWAIVLEKLERTKPCTVCYYYYGQDEITCAVHPMGRLAEVCRDWDLIQ